MNNGTTKKVVCYRIRSSPMCGCTIPCLQAVKEVNPTQITDNIFVGPVQASYKWDQLKELGVTHVINLCNDSYDYNTELFQYLRITIDDSPTEDIAAHFQKSNNFIEGAIKNGGKVLVHCYAGRSRSPTIIAAHLIGISGLSYDETMTLLEEKIKNIAINSGFKLQLKQYASDREK